MSVIARPRLRTKATLIASLPLLALLAACTEPLDFDLRGQIGAFNTTKAAQTATAKRPRPDDRGLITYPNYQVAVARRGDTVADVAARVGLPAQEIASFNGVQPGDKLRADEVLVLPRNAAPGTATPGSVDIAALAGQAIDDSPDTTPAPGSISTATLDPAPAAPVVAPKVQSGPEPVRHKVERGETAYTIARLYQVPVRALADWNGLGSDFAIREGQFLLIPVKDKPAPTPSPAAVTQPGQGTATPTPPSATKPLPDEKVASVADTPEPPKVKVDPPTRASQADMLYPVQGKIIATYSKGKNDGIDIAAADGTPVKAAAAGKVVAITEDTNQVSIIVVRHGDSDLLTVYANVDTIKVKRGDRVARGEDMAKVQGGSLHFEVRNGVDSVNPLPYLE